MSPDAKRLLTVLVTCAITLLVFEGALRLMRGSVELPYEPGERAYHALGPDLRQFGAADVSIVGNSRAREGLLAPEIKAALPPTLKDLTVGNYALAGSRAAAVEVVVRRLLEAEKKPKLIVYGMTPRQLAEYDDGIGHRLPLLWRVGDWWAARGRMGSTADAVLPEAIKNSLAATSLLFSFRWEFQDAMKDVRRPLPLYQAAHRLSRVGINDRFDPMRGSLPKWQQGRARNATRKVSDARLKAYLGDRFQEPTWPHTRQLERLRALIAACKTAGVGLLLVEAPLRDDLARHLPAGVEQGFREAVAEVAAEADVMFVPVASLQLALSHQHWRDQSHLNLRGAQAFTRKVAPFVVKALERAR